MPVSGSRVIFALTSCRRASQKSVPRSPCPEGAGRGHRRACDNPGSRRALPDNRHNLVGIAAVGRGHSAGRLWRRLAPARIAVWSSEADSSPEAENPGMPQPIRRPRRSSAGKPGRASWGIMVYAFPDGPDLLAIGPPADAGSASGVILGATTTPGSPIRRPDTTLPRSRPDASSGPSPREKSRREWQPSQNRPRW